MSQRLHGEAQRAWSCQNAAMRWVLVVAALAVGGASVPTTVAAAGDWVTVAPMPTARGGLAAVTGADGHIYAIGGFGGANGSELSTVESYSPTTNSWATKAPMPTARGSFAAALGHDGRIYAIGGDGPCGVFTKVEAYTPTTKKWATVASMPIGRSGLAAATGADGRIYAIGGRTCGTSSLATVEAYTPATNRWATVASMPTPRADLAAATGPDGRIYAFGGDSSSNPCVPGGVSTVDVYTPTTNSWATAAPMPAPLSCLAAATGADGRIYAIDGAGAAGYFTNSLFAYTPGTNSWAILTTLTSPRSNLAAATAPDGRIYGIGGVSPLSSAHPYVNTNEAYATAVSAATTPVPSATPRPRPVVNAAIPHPSGVPVPVIVIFAVAGIGVVVGLGLFARSRREGQPAFAQTGAASELAISSRESAVIRQQARAPDAPRVVSATEPVLLFRRAVPEEPVLAGVEDPSSHAKPQAPEAAATASVEAPVVPAHIVEPVSAAEPQVAAEVATASVDESVVPAPLDVPEALAIAGPVAQLDDAPGNGPSTTIFLCYRREDTSGYAGRLFDALVARFGEASVFMDIDTIAPGQDFVQVIEAALVDCEIVLVLIGPNWLSARDKRKRRRLDNPADFVRMEIEGALSRGLRVLPVLMGGAEVPSSRELPASLAALTRRHAFEISDRRWRYDVQALLAALLVQSKALARAVAANSPNEAHSSEERGTSASPGHSDEPTQP